MRKPIPHQVAVIYSGCWCCSKRNADTRGCFLPLECFAESLRHQTDAYPSSMTAPPPFLPVRRQVQNSLDWPWLLQASRESNCNWWGKRDWLFEKPKVGGKEPRVQTTSLLWDPKLRSRADCWQIERAGISRKMCLRGHGNLSRPSKGILLFSSAGWLQFSWVPCGLCHHSCAVPSPVQLEWSVCPKGIECCCILDVGSVHPTGEGPHHLVSSNATSGLGDTLLGRILVDFDSIWRQRKLSPFSHGRRSMMEQSCSERNSPACEWNWGPHPQGRVVAAWAPQAISLDSNAFGTLTQLCDLERGSLSIPKFPPLWTGRCGWVGRGSVVQSAGHWARVRPVLITYWGKLSGGGPETNGGGARVGPLAGTEEGKESEDVRVDV